jgi:hypothetical protein
MLFSVKPVGATCSLFRGSAWVSVLVGMGLAIGGCETSPSRPVSAAKPSPPTTAKAGPTPLALTAQDFVPPTAAQRGYHHYRGIFGDRPVELELTVTVDLQPYASVVGRSGLSWAFHYLDSRQIVSGSSPGSFPPSQPLEIGWTDWPTSSQEGMLCTDQPVGPLLTGTYALGRWLVPFRVQEDYSDCLRYEVLHEETAGFPERHGEDTLWASVEWNYLHLLGADTLRPARARIQCPQPAQRERARMALARELGSGMHGRRFMDIQVNEANLLAYTVEDREEYYRSRYYESRVRQILYDLRRGRELRLFDQLRPGGRRRLLWLLHQQAMTDTARARNRDFWRKNGILPLPDRGFTVTTAGLEAYYAEHESEPDMHGYSQTIAWAALRPLLRPDSPLHRLLRRYHQ